MQDGSGQGSQVAAQALQCGLPVAIAAAKVQDYAALRPGLQGIKKSRMIRQIGHSLAHHIRAGRVEHSVLAWVHGKAHAALVGKGGQAFKLGPQFGLPVKMHRFVRSQRNNIGTDAHERKRLSVAVAQHGFQRTKIVPADGQEIVPACTRQGKTTLCRSGQTNGFACKAIAYHGMLLLRKKPPLARGL